MFHAGDFIFCGCRSANSVVGCQKSEGQTFEVLQVPFLEAVSNMCFFLVDFLINVTWRCLFPAQGGPFFNLNQPGNCIFRSAGYLPCSQLIASSSSFITNQCTDMLPQPFLFNYRGATDSIGSQKGPTQHRTQIQHKRTITQ
jgi:hypothetical protein